MSAVQSEETRAVCPATSELKETIGWWEREVGQAEERVAETAAQIQDLRNSLRAFAGEYTTRVGVHFLQLDKVKLQIEMYRFRMKRLAELGTTEETLRQIEEEVDKQFGKRRKEIDEREKQTRRASDEYRRELSRRERAELLPEELRLKLRAVFRKLALHFHPDKADSEQQQADFHAIMAAINEAYANGDLAVLVMYMEKAARDEKIKVETPKEKLLRLKKEHKQLQQRLAKLEKERAEILAEELWELRGQVVAARDAGEDLLAELTRRVLNELRQRKEVLEELVTQYGEMAGGLRGE
jgi:hypothetical protein